MGNYNETFNQFFVNTFNKILLWEEQSLRNAGLTNLSVKELHVIEATHRLALEHNSTMSRIAASLSISVGALTTAVNALVKKGYLYRGGDENDRRRVYIYLTESGLDANEKHAQFHKNMISEITEVLDEKSLKTLDASLNQLGGFFDNLIK